MSQSRVYEMLCRSGSEIRLFIKINTCVKIMNTFNTKAIKNEEKI